MKAIKLVLLGTAALATVSVCARADNLSDLKAQIESLDVRVATLEATPAMPAGYSMVAFSKGTDLIVPGFYFGNQTVGTAHVISVVPAADAPAAGATVITWSGYVQAAIVTGHGQANFAHGGIVYNFDGYATDIRAKAHLKVEGKTDTSVGEVGARVELQAPFTDIGHFTNAGNGPVLTDDFWGWWKMTPNLTLGAGVDGSLAKNTQSFDDQCNCYYTNNWVGPVSNNPLGDPAQIRLSYSDGPIGVAVAVEDSNNYNNTSAFGVAGKAAYTTDAFSVDVSGGFWGNAGNTSGTAEAAWVVDIGVGADLGSIGSVSAAVAMGSGSAIGDDYTKASSYLNLTISDTSHAELGLGHVWNTSAGMGGNDFTELDAGLYYDPVDQLTLGIEASYESGGPNDGAYRADVVSIFRF